MMTFKINVETPAYDAGFYQRPWIAKVQFKDNPQGEFLWGQWIGDPGYPGLLEIAVSPGDIVATGQKDLRNPKLPGRYHVVETDGTLRHLPGGKAEALKVWRELHGESFRAQHIPLVDVDNAERKE